MRVRGGQRVAGGRVAAECRQQASQVGENRCRSTQASTSGAPVSRPCPTPPNLATGARTLGCKSERSLAHRGEQLTGTITTRVRKNSIA